MSANSFRNSLSPLPPLPRLPRVHAAWPFVMGFVSVVLWCVSLRSIDIRQMNDLGLISVLGFPSFAALGLLTVSFCALLVRPTISTSRMLLFVAALIFMLYGVTTLTQEMPRFETVYKHLGIIEYIIRNEDVDPMLTAYFSWPGFFIVSAFFTEATGVPSTMYLVTGSAVFFNLLYIGPLLLIYRSVTNDRRLIWLGVWVFYITNWIGQDYFAPQALHYFVSLTIIGILMRWFKSPVTGLSLLRPFWQPLGIVGRWLNKLDDTIIASDTANAPSTPWQRMLLMAICILLFAVIVPSHQLTPIATLASVLALVFLNRITPRVLPILMAMIILAWMVFMTTTFLDSHMNMVVGHVGDVSSNVTANVTRRIQGSQDHMFVIRMRLVATVMLWGLAVLGALWRLRKGTLNLSMALLAVTPVSLVAAGNYGGELVLRIYLFSLPFMSFFVAALFFPTKNAGRSWRTPVAIALLSFAFLGSFMVTRYGNERMDFFTAKEFDAVEQLYAIAQPGDQFVAVSYNLPWKYQRFEQYRYRLMTKDVLNGNFDAITEMMHQGKQKSYLIITRSQQAQLELFSGLPHDEWRRLEDTLQGSGTYKLLFANEDAQIFSLAAPK